MVPAINEPPNQIIGIKPAKRRREVRRAYYQRLDSLVGLPVLRFGRLKVLNKGIYL